MQFADSGINVLLMQFADSGINVYVTSSQTAFGFLSSLGSFD